MAEPLNISPAEAARRIDHTLLKPDATSAAIQKLCQEAVHWSFAAVCVNPWHVQRAAEWLSNSEVRVATVAGFPLGATWPRMKMLEAEKTVRFGAHEIDVVINIGALKSGELHVVEEEIRGVTDVCHRRGAICKAILEMALLTKEEKVVAARTAQSAGADFVKTSTGFGPGGATVEDVRLIRGVVGDTMGVKAAGGIRTWDDLKRLVAAGASRVGTSSGVRIMEEAVDEYAAQNARPRSR